MPPWLPGLLTWLKDNAAWLVAAWAVWIAIRGRRFDAQRAYAEFLLKARIDAGTEVLKAANTHFQLLAEASAARAALNRGNLNPVVQAMAETARQRALDAMPVSMTRLNEASAAARPFFSTAFAGAVSTLFRINQDAQASGGTTFDFDATQTAMNSVVAIVRDELDVEQAIQYQRGLFKRVPPTPADAVTR
jgi:hypothetical protein